MQINAESVDMYQKLFKRFSTFNVIDPNRQPRAFLNSIGIYNGLQGFSKRWEDKGLLSMHVHGRRGTFQWSI